ncbi:tetratricopeptide repeat protein 24 isoform X2 [Hemicordylus capensis]|uniref:tetratricopeptide repeat protein 24 isoform X2 n=1 Tax=Hemicordylus capensis TaxID=884348 RepID=UPI002304904A|nr:tetratricopeptide repeat protein 24 isoform X2 [Hemicordylus capensis]
MASGDPSVPEAELTPQCGPEGPRLSGKKKKEKKRRKERAEAEQEPEKGCAGDPSRREGQVEALTREGHAALLLGQPAQALACFKKAFALALATPSAQAQQACALNLGAAYVEAGQPQKGLELLARCRPEEGDAAEHLGDLFFNVGAAHEGLGDFPQALESFRKAQAHYRSAQAGSEASTSLKMGYCYLGMADPARAAQCFLEAGRAFAEGESWEAAALALAEAAGHMLRSPQHGASQVVEVLNECRSLCERIPSRALLGKLYNDIGLSFSQLRIFPLAAESFEKALPLCQSHGGDQHREAAVLQNLGAAHNALGNFGPALGFHRRAASLHSALGNRRAQGQCFGNLAFAFSQLGDQEAAGENYLHALQAFKDSDDRQGQWQACEGLASSCLHLGDPEKAIVHYKEALALLSACQDVSETAQERIVNKLTDALQNKLSMSSRCFRGSGRVPAAPLQPFSASQSSGQARFAMPLHENAPPTACEASHGSEPLPGQQGQRVSAPLNRRPALGEGAPVPQSSQWRPPPAGVAAQLATHGDKTSSSAPRIPNGLAVLAGSSAEDPKRQPLAAPGGWAQVQADRRLPGPQRWGARLRSVVCALM